MVLVGHGQAERRRAELNYMVENATCKVGILTHH